MRIGCLFGTFDPPHNGHMALAEHMRKTCALDQVWLVVTPQNPFKQDRPLSPEAHRLAMVRLARDTELRHALAANAHAHWQRHHTLEAMRDGYEAALAAIATTPRVSRPRPVHLDRDGTDVVARISAHIGVPRPF